MRLATIPVLLLLVSLGLAAAENPDEGKRTAVDERTRDARNAITRFEARLEEYRALPPSRRLDKERGLEGELEDLVEEAEDTRLENKALYLLASWRIAYRQGKDAEELLRRISRGRNLQYQNLALAQLARLRLAQGRLTEARAQAEAVTGAIPELQPLLDLIDFHGRVGQRAPVVVGRNLGDGPDEPISARAETWLLYCFIDLADPEQRYRIESLLEELRHKAFHGHLRLVCVSFDANPLGALSRLGSMDEGAAIDLLWANPNQGGDAATWRKAWQLPTLPVSVLLGPGPHRMIMAVDPGPDQLRPLVGLRPRSERDLPSGGRGWHGLRGRKRD